MLIFAILFQTKFIIYSTSDICILKTIGTIILFLLVSNIYSQSLSLDYKNVGKVNNRNSITLGHQFEGLNGSPMESMYLWDMQTTEPRFLLTEKWASDIWHYHSFGVSGWKTGSYKFIVGFGKNISEEIEFFVWNRE